MIRAVAGAVLPIDTTGVDFAMTALFVVIAVEQWESVKQHLPALLGFGVTLVSLLIVGAENMLPPALVVMVGLLLLLRGRLERSDHAKEKEKEESVC